LPGQTATFDNYTSYDRGINGIMVDIAGPPLAADPLDESRYFRFAVGNDEDPAGWSEAPTPKEVTLRPGAGVDDSTRFTIIWDDHAIERQWLQVTVLANQFTRLAEPDVFYFGNAVGESGNLAGDARVNAVDVLLARNNPRTLLNEAEIDLAYDFNRDQRVSATDMLVARANQTSLVDALKLITVPGGNDEAQMTSDEVRVAALSGWLCELELLDGGPSQTEETWSVEQAAEDGAAMLLLGDRL